MRRRRRAIGWAVVGAVVVTLGVGCSDAKNDKTTNAEFKVPDIPNGRGGKSEATDLKSAGKKP